MPTSAEKTPATSRSVGVSASRTERSTLSAVARTESLSESCRCPTVASERSSGSCACTFRIRSWRERHSWTAPLRRRSWYSNVPSSNGAWNSLTDASVSENEPFDKTGAARVPARSTAALIEPRTPDVSRCSSA